MNKGHFDHFEIWNSFFLRGATVTAGEIEQWIERGLDVHFKSPKYGHTMLTLFLYRSKTVLYWKEICLMLIGKGIEINYTNENGTSAFTLVCERNSFEQVEFLMNHGVDVNCYNNEGVTPLMFACANRNDYARIIPYLISKGASLTLKDKCKRRALEWAFQHGSLVFGFILPYYVSKSIHKMSPLHTMESCIDPFNCTLDAISAGCVTNTETIIIQRDMKEYEWLSFQLELFADNFTFAYLPNDDLKAWRQATSYYGSARGTDDGDTLLHLACRNNNVEAVRIILRRKIVNPYLRNRDYLTADALTNNAVIARMVHDYQMFCPTLQYADWLGPYFVKKAMALLLVNHRLRLFPKDVLFYILGWIARLGLY